jgi:hypothetical protein
VGDKVFHVRRTDPSFAYRPSYRQINSRARRRFSLCNHFTSCLASFFRSFRQVQSTQSVGLYNSTTCTLSSRTDIYLIHPSIPSSLLQESQPHRLYTSENHNLVNSHSAPRLPTRLPRKPGEPQTIQSLPHSLVLVCSPSV